MKKITILISVLLLTSCANSWKFRHNVRINQEDKICTLDSDPQVEYKYVGDLSKALINLKFIERTIDIFKSAGEPGIEILNIEEENDPDFYQLFFLVGEFYLSDAKNQALAYAIINLQWQDWVHDSLNKNDYFSLLLQQQNYNIVRSEEFKSFFSEYQLTQPEMRSVSLYVNNYLLNDILFVSVQELQERDWRYFSRSILDTFFMQGVVLMEMTEFARFIKTKYGYSKLLDLAKIEYSEESWTKAIGETIFEVEDAFAEKMENVKYDGIFSNQSFLDDLDSLLSLYNTGTKETLFHLSE